jgi:cobalamin biosynthetic protein CobC
MTAGPIIDLPSGKGVAHGGDLGAVRRRHPGALEPWIDLSTGINPLPYPVSALPSEVWSRLPSPEAEQALLEAAAMRYGCDAARIVAAPGTQALIQLLPRLARRSRVAIVGTTYAEHELCWRRHGHDVAVVGGLADAAGADVVVVVNPDNPTGRLVGPQALRALGPQLLVVDEAFIDLSPPEASLVRDLPDNALVLRSFGKTYGLAGIRLGFAIASQPLALRLREELGPWAVAGPALAIGAATLADTAWLQTTARRLAMDSARLDALLAGAGFTVLGGTSLFRLASHPRAPSLVERLAEHGIHVRAFAHRPMWLRFGLPAGDGDFNRLAQALQVPQKVR